MTRNKYLMAALASAAFIAVPAAAQVETEVAQPDTATATEPAGTTTTTTTDTITTETTGESDTIDTGSTVDTGSMSSTTTTTDTTVTQSGATQVASAADVKAGAAVLDPQGGEVGTIESVDANGAVISTGKARVQIPVASFAKNDKGLVISLTKAQLEAQASQPSA